MKLVKVNNPRKGQLIQCCKCKKWCDADTMKADLYGTPYKAYYCKECAK